MMDVVISLIIVRLMMQGGQLSSTEMGLIPGQAAVSNTVSVSPGPAKLLHPTCTVHEGIPPPHILSFCTQLRWA